jgi:peptidoglycan/xylan/chitin deacetylase (PgdA/CDA1 family)
MTINLEQFARWQFFLKGSNKKPKIPLEIMDMLTVRWEWERPSKDSRGNHEFQHNPLFWEGRYLEPVVNLWLANQTNNLNSTDVIRWPNGKKFAVCLTHDVDAVTIPSLQMSLRLIRKLLPAFLKNRQIAKSWVSALYFKTTKVLGCDNTNGNTGSLKGLNSDLFGPLIALEAKYGFQSTFFFLPEETSHYHVFDGSLYRYNDRIVFEGQRLTVAELMRELDYRGWEIGLHGTYNSYADSEELKRQKSQVESALRKEIVSSRQHYLHFDITQTPLALANAGFKYDSTFGSNRMIGFRNGLAIPFYFYDLKADRPIPLLELPLHIMDVSLLSSQHLDLTPPEALERTKQLIDRVEAVQGLITLLWHPNVINQRRYPGWFWVYEQLLDYISRKDAWVATVGAIGQWWENRLRFWEVFGRDGKQDVTGGRTVVGLNR